MYKKEYRDLLQVMDDISYKMPEIIYLKYWDKFGNKHKHLFSLYSESFKSTFSICRLLSDGCVCQSAVVLRLLLESVSIICILSDHPELIERFAKHNNIRLEVAMMDKKEELETLKKYFPNVKDGRYLAYMDYGWFEPLTTNRITEKEMIAVAGLSDLISWKEKFFDKIAHQSFTTEVMIGQKDGEIPFVGDEILILCKLFDHLCVHFHNLTKYDFVNNGIDDFNDRFRKIYKDL